MFKMENVFDVVETNAVHSRDLGYANEVRFVAGEDIENGRFVVIEDNVATYAEDANGGDVYLVTTPERLYNDEGIDEFYNPKGHEIRCITIFKDNIFSTTACEEDADIGDKLTIGAEGKLVAGEEGDMVFEVEDKTLLGKEIGVTVRRIK